MIDIVVHTTSVKDKEGEKDIVVKTHIIIVKCDGNTSDGCRCKIVASHVRDIKEAIRLAISNGFVETSAEQFLCPECAAKKVAEQATA